MAKTYSRDEIKDILHQLGIETINGKINSRQVAAIWTWRIQDEQGIEHTYTDVHVRSHVNKKTLPVADTLHARMNLFEVKDAFAATLNLNRSKRKKNTITVSCL